jgi:[NiFe] hydrogenase diaphorase moiety large subunit
MLGSAELLDYMCTQLWVERGKTSEDGLVSIDTASCTGMCDQGPALLVNNYAITRVTRQRVDEMCELIRNKVALAAWPREYFRVDDQVRRKDILLGNELAPGDALAAALARGPAGLLAELKLSNLRGCGGAGFAAGLKWQACRNAQGDAPTWSATPMKANPGPSGSRAARVPCRSGVRRHDAVRARHRRGKGMLYLRGEYRYLLDRLEAVLERRRRCNLLGTGILGRSGFDFDIETTWVPAPVCGEESALIESLEATRHAAQSPPFPVTHGYLDQPTVVNNVETFAASCLVAHRRRLVCCYRHRRVGRTKILSVSGDCARPGLYEYPAA